MPCKIVCPSRKRAGKVITQIDGMILCVAKSEHKEYKKHYPETEIITHDEINQLSLIRQFIYEKYKDVFMVDDDIVHVRRLYDAGKLSPPEVFELIQRTYESAKDVNAFLWGFNNDPLPVHYNQHKPFMFKGYINGCAIGLNESKKLYFTKKTVASESHWINLLNAYHHRFNFIDKRYCFEQSPDSTFLLEGGQVGRRTMETEKEDTLFLRKMFGDSVKVKKAKNKTLRKHKYQRELDIKL